MHRLLFLFPLLALLISGEPMPRLVKDTGGFHLMVNDRPFIILGIQTSNSSGFPAELERTWPLAKRIHVNTVEIPIQWQSGNPSRAGSISPLWTAW